MANEKLGVATEPSPESFYRGALHYIYAVQTRKRGSYRQHTVHDKEIFRRDTRDKTLSRDIHT